MFALNIIPWLLVAAVGTGAQTWCGKNYKKGSPLVPPDGQFPVPQSLSSPQLAFRCSPAIRPYLPDDAVSPPPFDPNFISFTIDTLLTHTAISGAESPPSSSGPLSVTVSLDNKNSLATGQARVNSSGTIIPFSLSGIKPSSTPYNVTCTARASSGETYTANTALYYLPSPPAGIGSVTRMDMRTGALWARPADGSSGPYAPVIPVGFYTQLDNDLITDLSIPAKLKAQGFNVVHPIPPFSNQTAFNAVLDAMEDAGLYLMYDTRLTYQNTSVFTSEINAIKSRRNLLLWYTADEPDGTSDPPAAATSAYDLIYKHDGYHPVSLVLNCQDYHFKEYTAGADIVLQDAYIVGNNATHSVMWDTPCNKSYGCCGCDNCQGSFFDISTRVDEFEQRLFVNGWERTKAVWSVPQGFGNDTYWQREPTAAEMLIQTILGVNHGSVGVVSWSDPAPAPVKSGLSTFALALPQLTPFITHPLASRRQFVATDSTASSGSPAPLSVDLAAWTVPPSSGSGSSNAGLTLVLATNPSSSPASVDLTHVLATQKLKVEKEVLGNSGASEERRILHFDGMGSGAWIVSGVPPVENANAAPGSVAKNDSRKKYSTLRAGECWWLISGVKGLLPAFLPLFLS